MNAKTHVRTVHTYLIQTPKYNIVYKNYLGDSDSRASKVVCEKKSCGSNYEINKLECTDHVQKRMEPEEKNLMLKIEKLSDGKTISGKGRLTYLIINKIQ